MLRKALLGLVVIAVFAVGCKSTVEKQGEVAAPAPAPVAAPAPAAPAPTPAAPAATALAPAAPGYEILRITADLPQELVEAANRQGCPMSAVSALFGAEISQPHGVVIGKLTPGGVAEKIGLRAGDSIVQCNGGEVTCPRTFVPLLAAPKDPGKVELIVHRPK
jgi:S1-C subfamily serine protease